MCVHVCMCVCVYVCVCVRVWCLWCLCVVCVVYMCVYVYFKNLFLKFLTSFVNYGPDLYTSLLYCFNIQPHEICFKCLKINNIHAATFIFRKANILIQFHCFILLHGYFERRALYCDSLHFPGIII